MITNTIKIGNKPINFSCSAGTLKRFRDEFSEDLLGEMSKLTSDEPDLDTLIKLAYIMAKQSGETMGYEEWLDQFDLMDFIMAIPSITAMWTKNNVQVATPKKK